ncbi:AAA family ATPase [Arthrobacter roseus]|uniref:AAA family ATPase n=1 Tax=Arthrobacter roseus TaxID=136274 RepID=UPI001963C1AB|nr:SMC family ATPase [Arthrobacter roseus]MBM7848984.1 exonuclease SbcC [Arthrobacter roseus]
MRIHSLEIQAFGPFAGREVVDFDALGAHGLFLLNGPTGAGKTSILDAICYALYGSVPGARQEGRRLRSDHADAETAPEVVCEFSARGRRFNVVRNPQWSRPSRRGGGTTTEQAHTLLSEWVDGAWVEKSARNDEAAAEITAILGMNREQFTRVVMLPQGDFAAFLRSDARSRRDLLQQLFNTDRFEKIELQLGAEAARARSVWEDRQSELERTRQRAVEAWSAHAGSWAGNHEIEGSAITGPEDASTGETTSLTVSAMLEQLKSVAAAMLASAQEHRVQMESARSASSEAQSRCERREALNEYRRRRHAWNSAQDQAADISTALQLHRKAEALASSFHRVEEALKVATAREQDTAARRQSLNQNSLWIAGPHHGQRVLEDVLTAESRAAGRTLGAIEAGLPDEHRLHGFIQERRSLQESVQKDGRRHAELLTGLDQRRQTKKDLEEKSAELVPAANSLKVAEQALESAFLQEKAVAENVARIALAEDIRGRHVQAKETALDKKAFCLALMRTRLEQASAELASRLLDDRPCPVCGSQIHPAPAVVGDGSLVSKEDEDRARQDQDTAESELESVAAKLSLVREEISALVARGGDQSSETVAGAVASAQNAVQTARTAAIDLADVQLRVSGIDQQIREDEELSSTLKDSLAESRQRLGHLEKDITTLEGRLLDLRAGHNTLAERKRAVAQYRDQLDEAREAAGRARAGREAATDAEAHLMSELAHAGFASVSDARMARLDPPTVRSFEEQDAARLREHIEVDALGDSIVVQAARADEEKAVPILDQAGLVELREVAQSTEEHYTQSRVQAGILAESVTQATGHVMKYEELERDAEPLRQQWELLGELAETARGGGDNTYRMTLGTYVLAARLEQVAIAATERLAAMTDGRYALVHSDARSGNRKSGLSLHVTDEWTGASRDTSTLSGGESFMASLALALGLADVVQQESGGVEMETLFVDEGFGSLDEQSLEQVMDALEGLRDGGRIVGLVSHVAEMKQRITAQLEVVKERTGSSIRFRELSV